MRLGLELHDRLSGSADMSDGAKNDTHTTTHRRMVQP